MIDNILTGRKIAELRLNRGLTQQQLAAMMSVSHQAVSKWESGQALPDIQTMLLLTQFFGITIEQLITEKGEIGEMIAPSAQEEPAQIPEVKDMNALQLVQMAPFMSKEAVEEIALGITDPISAAQLARLAPFIRPECLEALIAKHNPVLDWDSLRKLAPFMGREAVDALARKIASGETTVQPAVDPFNKTLNDIGKALDGFGRDVEKAFDDIGKGLEKGFDDFGKGLEKGLRKAVRFGENVVNEVNKAINAEEIARQAARERTERTRAIRRRAFERAVADRKWDWIALHIEEVSDDTELMALISTAAKELGMHDWVGDHMSAFADEDTVNAAILAGNWDWLGDNIWQFGSDMHEKVARAAAEAGNWNWLMRYSDPMELVNCPEEIARAAMNAGEYELLAQFADMHLTENQIEALAGEAYAAQNFEALNRLFEKCPEEFRSRVLSELSEAEDWDHVMNYLKHADPDLLEKLMETAVDQGNFDAIDMIDALL